MLAWSHTVTGMRRGLSIFVTCNLIVINQSTTLPSHAASAPPTSSLFCRNALKYKQWCHALFIPSIMVNALQHTFKATDNTKRPNFKIMSGIFISCILISCIECIPFTKYCIIIDAFQIRLAKNVKSFFYYFLTVFFEWTMTVKTTHDAIAITFLYVNW